MRRIYELILHPYYNYIHPFWYAKEAFGFTKFLWYKYSPYSKVPKDLRPWMRWSLSLKERHDLIVGGWSSVKMFGVTVNGVEVEKHAN